MNTKNNINCTNEQHPLITQWLLIGKKREFLKLFYRLKQNIGISWTFVVDTSESAWEKTGRRRSPSSACHCTSSDISCSNDFCSPHPKFHCKPGDSITNFLLSTLNSIFSHPFILSSWEYWRVCFYFIFVFGSRLSHSLIYLLNVCPIPCSLFICLLLRRRRMKFFRK